jgi:5-methylcytosine-specific restriction endonuclease McrA
MYIGRGNGKVKKICLQCNKEFESRHDRPGKFCSRICGGKNKIQPSFKKLMICQECSKEYLVKRYMLDTTKYCSRVCRQKNMPSGESHPRWNGGISERPHSARKGILQLLKTIKACQKCGSSIRLQGHHIIGYAERPDLANELSNIVILCQLCHSQEHPKYANLILKGGVYGNKLDTESNS